MATSTYTPIASITLGSSASSVTFSSIPQDYRDLVLVVNASGGTSRVIAQFNSDTGSNYSWVIMGGNGSSAFSVNTSSSTYARLVQASSGQYSTITQIMDYSATDKHKTLLDRGDNVADTTKATAARWANTAAITTLEVTHDNASTFDTGSTFALWGIAS